MSNPINHVITLLRQRDWIAGQLSRTDLTFGASRRLASQCDAIDYALDVISEADPETYASAEKEFDRFNAARAAAGVTP